MGQTLLFISISLTFLTTNTFSQNNKRNWVLLIHYDEYSEYKISEVNDKKIESKDYSLLFEEIDDFSEFFPTQKVFYYDGGIELKKEDLIIFWEYGYKKSISKLPYNHSIFSIESLINDSTLRIKIYNKQVELTTNAMVSDTVYYQKKEGDKLVNYKTVIFVENLGLIEKKNVIDNKTWETKKFELGLDAPLIVEVMPEFNGGQENFMEYLAKNISYPTLNESAETINTKLYIEFIINETGGVARTKVLRSVNPSFDKHVIEILENMPKWKPGMHEGKPVSVKMILPINIDFK